MKGLAIVFFLLFFFIISPAFAGAKSITSVKKYARQGEGVRISQRQSSSDAGRGERIIGDLLTSLDPLATREKGG